MSYLRGFTPWIVLAIGSSLVGWGWGALGALAVAVGMLWQDRRAGRSTGALEAGGAVFFAALAVVAFAAPASPLREYAGALSSAWLAVIAGYGLAVRNPFTLAIARRSVDAETSRHPRFLRVNTVITAVWAASFAVAALLGAACVAMNEREPVRIAVQVAAFVVPALFTKVYVGRIGERRAVLAAT